MTHISLAIWGRILYPECSSGQLPTSWPDKERRWIRCHHRDTPTNR